MSRPYPIDVQLNGLAFLQTRSGRRFWPLDARVEHVDIFDIAFSLAQQVRFGGFSDGYTVAQHSVLVSHACNPRHALCGLLHDASEAYLGDIPRPLKIMPEMECCRLAESKLMRVIYDRFGIHDEPSSVKAADLAVFGAEVRDLMQPWVGVIDVPPPTPETITIWPRLVAEYRFLIRYHELTGDPAVLCNPRVEILYREVNACKSES